MSSFGNYVLNFLPISYFATVFIAWIIANRLKVGLLFQKQIYVLSFAILLGVILGKAVLFVFPENEIAADIPDALGVIIGTAQLHKSLLGKVRSPGVWNVAISAISAVLFVILLLSNF
ncbi:hypothetical protein [Ruegeria sp. 6PALISEP08]|uniref:hypothetical protein n=1 Tax=Ruegeria sp. 6PALISEP08 TaxID=1225660 RepID=UPI00067F44CA|nr:hypothetical protein [Ruegeria sp. 6PALISEP08]